MDPFTALLLFSAYFASGALYSCFVRFASSGDASKAAYCSMTITLLMMTSVMKCIDDPRYLVPVLAGNGLGVYLDVVQQKHKRRLLDYAWTFYHACVLVGRRFLDAVVGLRGQRTRLVRQFRLW